MIPCSVRIAKLIFDEDRDQLSRLLGAKVPSEWPTQDTKDIVPLYLSSLEADPEMLGWGIWIAIHQKENTVVGDMGFKGKPDESGTVEIGYGIIPSYRNNGYATEAAGLLINWAFSHSAVKKVIAECLPDHAPSVRVLEKLNMQRTVVEDNMQKWELTRQGT
ncbi:ribosomal-protein-alanine N-acetyltransferase [Lihuaxuella thermophila]|uniref:Ribosomal-protein-alanine N-acetyltransferase n=1 Tax=Lihuaxuella thermophila TaxID=1173111 RepID=A0A1H8H4M0_9BACL|nr:ribosomal-protein-alanine N-acetyltransferase [Lihuaxuella thermophila]